MSKTLYFAAEVALCAAVPALHFFAEDLVATGARLLCVALLVLSVFLGMLDDRYFGFGFLFAVVGGAAWTAMIFGPVPTAVLWTMALIPLAELAIRMRAHDEAWNVVTACSTSGSFRSA